MTTRQALHDLVDRIPDDAIEAAGRALADLATEPHRLSLRERLALVPEDDEPLTPEDIAAIERGLASMRAGTPGLSQDEVERLIESL